FPSRRRPRAPRRRTCRRRRAGRIPGTATLGRPGARSVRAPAACAAPYDVRCISRRRPRTRERCGPKGRRPAAPCGHGSRQKEGRLDQSASAGHPCEPQIITFALRYLGLAAELRSVLISNEFQSCVLTCCAFSIHFQFMSLKRKKRVLAIDDEPSMTEWLKILLEHAGYEVRTALIGTRGEELFKSWRPDAVITDMMLPDIDGIELVRKFKQLDPEAEVIVITGQGNIPRSVEAVKAGAFDFLEKPIDAERLLDKLEKAIKRKSLMDENEQLKARLQDRYKFQNVVGKSKKMQELFDLVESVAAS